MECDCGETLEANQAFCRHCGKPVVHQKADEEATRILESDQTAPTAFRSSTPSHGSQSEHQREAASAKGLDMRLVTAGLIAVVLIAVTGLIAFAIVSLGKTGDETPVVAITPETSQAPADLEQQPPTEQEMAPSSLPPSSEFSQDCASGLQTNDVTTCAFGRALFSAWATEGTGRAGSYVAQSPATGDFYEVYCSGGNPVVCREINASDGANDAAVRFLR